MAVARPSSSKPKLAFADSVVAAPVPCCQWQVALCTAHCARGLVRDHHITTPNNCRASAWAGPAPGRRPSRRQQAGRYRCRGPAVGIPRQQAVGDDLAWGPSTGEERNTPASREREVVTKPKQAARPKLTRTWVKKGGAPGAGWAAGARVHAAAAMQSGAGVYTGQCKGHK